MSDSGSQQGAPSRQPVWSAHASCWTLSSLFRDGAASGRSMRSADRLLGFAAGLEPGAHLTWVLEGDGAGRVSVRLHTDSTHHDVEVHLPWIFEGVGRWERFTGDPHLADPVGMGCLFEIVPSVRKHEEAVLDLSDPLADDFLEFEQMTRQEWASRTDLWPVPIVGDGMDLISALATLSAQVRVHMAPPSLLEQQMLAGELRKSVQSVDPVDYSQYFGSPLRLRCMVAQTGPYLSPRLRSALMHLGVGLSVVPRDLNAASNLQAWRGEELSLSGSVEPYGVARCLVRVPAHGDEVTVCGMQTEEPEAKRVPLAASIEPDRTGLRIGSAPTVNGDLLDVTVDKDDLLLHTQVLGATGTGKSTLLAALVQEAVAAGMGVTVIEPHGTLLERIVDELPESMADRTVVVRSDDIDNPVPLNVLRGPRPEMVTDMMTAVIRDLFDPRSEGIVGPRFERAFSYALQTLQVLLGERANMSAIPFFFRDQKKLLDVAKLLKPINSDLSSVLVAEFGQLREADFGELSAWVNSKMQRLVSTPEMRAILGTGEDAVDVTKIMDHRNVLLVDLASPAIGPLGAQFLGEMWLAKHWQALAERKNTDQPHLLIVDEAHLFASGLLPRLLSEARKFGVGVVLAHQHLEQLKPELREATLATTNNVIVFRTGPREEITARMRLGDWPGGPLTRLPRLQAAATLSQGKNQSDAFTLIVDHNERVRRAPQPTSAGDAIDRASQARFVDPFRGGVSVTGQMIDDAVEKLRQRGGSSTESLSAGRSSGSSFLDEWLESRKRAQSEPRSHDIASASPGQDD